MDKKYFFFDIDGTLTDIKTGKIVQSARETLKKLEANGHFLAICTGRAYFTAKPVLEDLGIKNMVCYCGSGLVVDNVLVKNTPLPIDVIRDIVHECEANNIGYMLALDDSVNCYASNDLFPKQAHLDPSRGILHADANFDINKIEEVYKGFISVLPEDEYKLPSLKKVGPLRFKPDYLIVQYDKKAEGIVDMMNYLHADIKDVVTFGDDTNDIVMCDPRWTSIAMGNGAEKLKEKASYVTDTNVNDGIKKACEHFGWI